MKIGIIGLGLIGGSIAKALKIRRNYYISAMNRSEASLKAAFNEGIIDEYSLTDMSIFADCSIIFICTSVDKIPVYAQKLLPYIQKDCIITDVGSTKKSICNEMSKIEGINFIGGHPMAGSEKTGYAAAKEHLFENAFYILAPSAQTTEGQLKLMEDIVSCLGAVPMVINPDAHDYSVAAISHVPHIIASALVNTVKKLDDENKYMHTLAAGGFKDITRIASSSPEIWTSICSDNKEKILQVLSSFSETINEVKNHIEDSDDLSEYFNMAREYRNSFDVRNANTICSRYDFCVDVTDQPGAIASVATVLSLNGINIKNIGVVNSREYSEGVLQIVFDTYEEKEKSIAILKNMNYTIYDK